MDFDGYRLETELATTGRFRWFRVQAIEAPERFALVFLLDIGELEGEFDWERFTSTVDGVRLAWDIPLPEGWRDLVLPAVRRSQSGPWFAVPESIYDAHALATSKSRGEPTVLASLEAQRRFMSDGLNLPIGDLHSVRVLVSAEQQAFALAPGWLAAWDLASGRTLEAARAEESAGWQALVQSDEYLRELLSGSVAEPVRRIWRRDDPRSASRSGSVSGSAASSSTLLELPFFGALIDEPVAAPVVPQTLDDDLQFTLYRPAELGPRVWRSLLLFTHRSKATEPSEPDPLRVVQQRAERTLAEEISDYLPFRQEATLSLPREAELTLIPYSHDLEFNPRSQRFIWTEPVHQADFRVRTLESCTSTVARGGVRIFFGVLIVADISFAIPIGVREQARQAVPIPTTAWPFKRVFASYSHHDGTVVSLFERCANALGIQYLRDVSVLRAGEQWNTRLLELIQEANVFQLFWSSNSMVSQYVRQEWEHALAIGKPICPVFWENPFPENPQADLPPPALRSLHFVNLSGGEELTKGPTLARVLGSLAYERGRASADQGHPVGTDWTQSDWVQGYSAERSRHSESARVGLRGGQGSPPPWVVPEYRRTDNHAPAYSSARSSRAVVVTIALVALALAIGLWLLLRT